MVALATGAALAGEERCHRYVRGPMASKAEEVVLLRDVRVWFALVVLTHYRNNLVLGCFIFLSQET